MSGEKNKIKKSLQQGGGNQYWKYIGGALLVVAGGYVLYQQIRNDSSSTQTSSTEEEEEVMVNDKVIDTDAKIEKKDDGEYVSEVNDNFSTNSGIGGASERIELKDESGDKTIDENPIGQMETVAGGDETMAGINSNGSGDGSGDGSGSQETEETAEQARKTAKVERQDENDDKSQGKEDEQAQETVTGAETGNETEKEKTKGIEINIPEKDASEIAFEKDAQRYCEIKKSVDELRLYTYRDGELQVIIHCGKHLPKLDDGGKEASDPFVKIRVPHNKEKRTKYIENSTDPVWNENFTFKIRDALKDSIEFEVMDKDKFTKNDAIGVFSLPVIAVCQNNGQLIDSTFQLYNSKLNKKNKNAGKIQVSLFYRETAKK